MTNAIVPSDIEINDTIAAMAILDQFGIQPQKISLLGEGFDNAVYLVDDELVFRFPRREIAIPLLLHEIQLLGALSKKLPLPIPEPQFIGKPSQVFARPFFGHKLLPGNSGSAVTLSDGECIDAAVRLGQFLRALHSLSPENIGISPADLTVAFKRTEVARLTEVMLSRWRQIEAPFGLQVFAKKMHHLSEQAVGFVASHNTLVHGDLYHRHLVFDDHNRLAGIIDWGDSGLSDPAVDLGVVFQFFPKQAHDAFFKAYGLENTNSLAFARFLGFYLAVALLWFGHDRKDQDLIRTSLWTFKEI